MKISTSSWHYKLNCIFHEEWDLQHADNLCAYMRKLVVSISAGLFVSFVIIGLIFSFVAPFLYSIFRLNVPEFFLFAGVVAYTVVAALIILLHDSFVGEHWMNRPISSFFPRSRSKKEKTPSLLSQYLKAHKEKYCPTVEFIDE